MDGIKGRISDKIAKTDGLSIGYQEIDRMLQGVQKADLIVLAGRPSMGKTTLVMNIVKNISFGVKNQPPCPVAVFTLEMNAQSFTRRMISMNAKVSSKKLTSGKVGIKEHQAITAAKDALQRAPIYVEDSGFDMKEIADRARQLNKEVGIQFIVVDYLDLVKHAESRMKGFPHERVAVSHAMKGLAKELKIPILVVCQLCRGPDARDSIPRLTDLRPPGIEQDADVVMLLRRHRHSEEDTGAVGSWPVIVDIVKNRHGPEGEVSFPLDHSFL